MIASCHGTEPETPTRPADDARQHARWAIMTVTPFEVFTGLVIIAAVIMIALTVRRWDD